MRPITTSSANYQSETPNTTSLGKKSSKGLKLVVLALTGFTVGIGYATLNPDARRQIESVLPQSQQIFTSIDKYLNLTKINNNFETKPAEIPKLEPIQKEAPKKPVVNVKQQQQPQTERQNQVEKQKDTKLEKETNLDWKKTLKEFDLQEEASVNAIENRLHQLDESVKVKVSEALNSSYAAIDSLNKYRQALRNALDEKSDSTKELEWRQVTDLFDLQQSDVNEANEKFLIAKFVLFLQELDLKF